VLCPFYSAFEETLCHAIFECSHTKEVWTSSKFSQVLFDAPNSSFSDKTVWMYDQLKGKGFVELLGMVWACWKARNSIVMNNDRPNVNLLVARFDNMIKDHAKYMMKVHGETPQAVPHSSNKWFPLP